MKNLKPVGIVIFLLMKLTSSSQDSTSKKEIASALRLLNKARISAGLDTVTLSATLSKGCNSHAKYLYLNKNNPLTDGLNAHKEFPKLKGFTKEGEIAGKSSVIHYVSPTEAIDGWIQTFYHRIPLLQPNLKEVGIGYFQKEDEFIALIDCISGATGKNTMDVVYYPSENQKNVPISMGLEIPHPVGPDGSYGFPVTIYFANFQKITNVNLKITDKNKKSVDCYISTPAKPATSFSQWNSICAIPKATLSASSSYTVTLTCNVDNVPYKKTYSFETRRP